MSGPLRELAIQIRRIGGSIRLHLVTVVALPAAAVCALLFGSSEAVAQTGGSLASADASFHGLPNDDAGRSLAGAGDVNGDGFDDLVVGAPLNDLGPSSDGGTAFLVRGGPGGWGTETAFFQQSSIIAYTGELGSDNAGASVAGAGDFNGDGFDDLVVGAPLEGAGGAGAAYIVLGSATPTPSVPPAGGSLGSPEHIELTGEAAGDRAGTSVAGAGDINGDGFDDIIVGAPFNADAGAGAGAAYLLLGSATPADGSLGVLGIEYTGEATVIDDNAGTSVGGGDFEGDGDSDLIVGAPGNDEGSGNNAGSAYIVPGATAGLPAPGTTTSLGVPTVVQLTGDIDGDAAGTSVALGDVTGDGRADALVGAPLSDAGVAASNMGAAYVVPGRAGCPTTRSVSPGPGSTARPRATRLARRSPPWAMSTATASVTSRLALHSREAWTGAPPTLSAALPLPSAPAPPVRSRPTSSTSGR